MAHSYRPDGADEVKFDGSTLTLSYRKYTVVLPASGSTILASTAIAALIAVQTGSMLTNAILAGTVTMTGIQALSGAGAVDVVTFVTKITNTGTNALTLADGVNGQLKAIVYIAGSGTSTLTPATKTGFSTIAFAAVGQSVLLQFYTTLGWMILSNNGSTAS